MSCSGRTLRNDPALSLTLLVSDVLAFNPTLTNEQRDILVGALRYAITPSVDYDGERNWFQRMLDAELGVTLPYGSGREMAYSVIAVKEPA